MFGDLFLLDNACVDTPNFNNGYGHGCASYVANGWCKDGAAVSGQEWTLGVTYRTPEHNCCECGKQGEVVFELI